MHALLHDLRFAFRTLFKRPVLAALALLTLALGIGANTAIFSLVNGFLIQPLPWNDSERLVQVWNTYPLMNLSQATVSIPDYLDRREAVEAFEASALYHYSSFNFAEGGAPERVVGLRTTSSLFPLLGVEAAHGRVFGAGHDEPGSDQVVVLRWDFWQRRFGGDESLVGQKVLVDGETYEVLGVMPEGFFFPNDQVDLWRPFAWAPEEAADDQRGREYSQMIARLAPGASGELAQQQIDAIHERNKERFPEAAQFWETSGFGGMVFSLRDELYGELRPRLLMVQIVVAFVLLIACANVANLLLTRLAARRRELAVRSALGADRWELARQILVEGLVLSLGGALGGLVLGGWLLAFLKRTALESSRVALELDLTVFLFTTGLAVLTALVFSLFPVVSTWRTRPMEVIQEGSSRGAAGGRGSGWTRKFLVVAELTLATALLVAAGLLLRTFDALQNEDPGLRTENVLMAQVSLPEAKYDEPEKVMGFYTRALERMAALPGVNTAAVTTNAPFGGSSSSGSYSVDGYELAEGESGPHAFQTVVSEGFFDAVDIELLRGRGFRASDDASSEPVVVVDRLLVEKYFAGDAEEALGGRILRGPDDDRSEFRIVGIVETVKTRRLDEPQTKETIYYPYRQAARSGMTFVLSTEVTPSSLTTQVKDAVQAVDPRQPVYGIVTMDEQLFDRLRPQRLSMQLLVGFGALAALLAAVGIYGVLAFSVAQRVRELGVRMALGAGARDVLALVLRQGAALSAIGIFLGLGLALGLGRFLESMLFEVRPHDPATLAGVGAFLFLVAVVACLHPAWKASRVDPMEALREE